MFCPFYKYNEIFLIWCMILNVLGINVLARQFNWRAEVK